MEEETPDSLGQGLKSSEEGRVNQAGETIETRLRLHNQMDQAEIKLSVTGNLWLHSWLQTEMRRQAGE